MAGYAYKGQRPQAGGVPECGTMAAVAVHLRAGVKPRDLDYKCRVAISDYKAGYQRVSRPPRGELTPEQLEAAREAERRRYTPRAELPPEEQERLREAGRRKSAEERRRGVTEEEAERRRARNRAAYARRQERAGRTVVPRPSARKSTPAQQRAAQQLENKRARDRKHYANKAAAEGRTVVPRDAPRPEPEPLELYNVDRMLARRRKPGPARKTA